MDGKQISLFEDGTVNPQSKEEDEEIEEQKRLQEELEDLLTDGIHPFRYEDSTGTSTNISTCSVDAPEQNSAEFNNKRLQFNDPSKNSNTNFSEAILKNLEQDYKDAMPKEQLKVLYEIRLREIASLRDEFKQYQINKENEIKLLKNRNILSEAELRHSQVSVTNLESLLVEKTEIIRNLTKEILEKNSEVENLRKTVEKLNIEISTYSATVNELQMKQCESNPFNKSSRAFQSEEKQRAHQERIVRLETLLEEQKKRSEIMEKEKNRLEDEMKRIIKNRNEIEEQNSLTILALTKKLQSTQRQCKDLFNLGEALKKESDHFKARLQQISEHQTNILNNSATSQMDNAALSLHVEKLKRMLLDKDMELNCLLAKQKFYEKDMNELFEYRDILNSTLKSAIKACSNCQFQKQFVDLIFLLLKII